ncbi:hypothetical protein OKW50_008289 [Paraburkholderia youngii]|uniref:hypothetical protein n=1 Tax=Paraburkholderia youngii TaxID=2782701 RepID=UPI003D216560
MPISSAPIDAAQLVPPAEGTFLFTYRTTGHDDGGEATISATVRATFGFGDPGQARAVQRNQVQVQLQIPIVDASTGQPAVVELPGSCKASGVLFGCSFDIKGNVARAVYGALSIPNFQGNRIAKLIVNSTFDAIKSVSRLVPVVPARPVRSSDNNNGNDYLSPEEVPPHLRNRRPLTVWHQ